MTGNASTSHVRHRKRLVTIPTDPRVYEFYGWYWYTRWGR